jgi:hypothetical protein
LRAAKLNGYIFFFYTETLLAFFVGTYDRHKITFEAVTLVNEKFETLEVITLNETGDGAYTGKVVLPKDPFRAMMNGTVKHNSQADPKGFQRLQADSFTPAQLDVTITNEGLSSLIQINRYLRLNFTVSNHGPATSITIEGRDTLGLITQTSPTKYYLGDGESVKVTVTLFATASKAMDGQSDTVTVSATTSSGSTNYAMTRIVVMPEVITDYSIRYGVLL